MLLTQRFKAEQNDEMQIDNWRDLGSSELFASVILIEEHPLVRAALAQNLRMQSDIELLQVSPFLPSRPKDFLPLNPEVILIGLPLHSVASLHTLAGHVEAWSEAGIAIIVSTPYLKVEEEKLLFDSGIFAYIHKTIDAERLKKIISAAKAFYRPSVDQ